MSSDCSRLSETGWRRRNASARRGRGRRGRRGNFLGPLHVSRFAALVVDISKKLENVLGVRSL